MYNVTLFTDQGKDLNYLELGLKLGKQGYQFAYEKEEVMVCSDSELNEEEIKYLMNIALEKGKTTCILNGKTFSIT